MDILSGDEIMRMHQGLLTAGFRQYAQGLKTWIYTLDMLCVDLRPDKTDLWIVQGNHSVRLTAPTIKPDEDVREYLHKWFAHMLVSVKAGPSRQDMNPLKMRDSATAREQILYGLEETINKILAREVVYGDD